MRERGAEELANQMRCHLIWRLGGLLLPESFRLGYEESPMSSQASEGAFARKLVVSQAD
jgi:hypothetical protein